MTTNPVAPVPPRVTLAIAIDPDGTKTFSNRQTTPPPAVMVTSVGAERAARRALQFTAV